MKTTLVTVASMSLVVVVFVGVMSIGTGVERALATGADPRTVLVLRAGSSAENQSFFPRATARELATLPEVGLWSADAPGASPEFLALKIFERADGTESNVVVRGVTSAASKMRSSFEILAGRPFEAGRAELIVGEQLLRRFPQLTVGREVELGRIAFKVVGGFRAEGGGASSEVWGALEEIGDAFDRASTVSVVRLRAAANGGVERLLQAVSSDPRWEVDAIPEKTYYEQQATATARLFKAFAILLGLLMGFGACFAAANTMYTQISKRSREIGALRTLGFRQEVIVAAFLVEAAVLGALGGALGVALSLPLAGLTAGTTNATTFAEVAFRVAMTPAVLTMGFLLAVATAIVGGFPPAWGASRRSIATLIREA